MKYWKLLSIHNLALLSDWLEETGELFVDVYRPHSGGGSFHYFIKSISEFRRLIQGQNSEEIEITVFREQQYSLRGIADEEMLEKALSLVEDGEWYAILSLRDDFPNSINFLSDGDRHSEIREDFSKFAGQEIGFGPNPLEAYDDAWFSNNRDKFFKLSVTKSYYGNGNYVNNPEQYKWLEELL